MKKATTNAALKRIIEEYIPECGKFDKILSDNGSQFTANKWKIELEKLGIKVVDSSQTSAIKRYEKGHERDRQVIQNIL